MEFLYKTPTGLEKELKAEEMLAGEAVVLTDDLEKTGRLKQVTFWDQEGHVWSLKELREYIKGIQTEPHHIKVYFDGGYDLESKQSGLGCVIYYDQDGKSYRLRKKRKG